VAKPTVCVSIVTFNSARYIGRCLDELLCQEGVNLEVIVADNGSTDDTRQTLRRFRGRIRTILHGRNLGFAEAQNTVIRSSSSEWVLTLNPDVLVEPGFVRALVEAGETDPGTGTVCGKLRAIGPGFVPLDSPRIDSAGIYFTPALRHFDRGWHEPDVDSYNQPEYVFGATAAAALYRRGMIEDVSIDGAFFDPDFFVYREDADVAWRAQLLGWHCLYTPAALAYHVRTMNPWNRRSVPSALNMHSVKNRFLMRIKNATGGLYRGCGLSMTLRDAVVVGASLLWEPTSLVAFWRVLRCLPRTLAQRKIIMGRRRASDHALARWFQWQPAAFPVVPVVDLAASWDSSPRTAPPAQRADLPA
jgi:GT2 family glycosyltransferase